jgi:hypothetical protein
MPGEANFDSAPVAKITDYPLEERDYRPFAQCVLCLAGGRLHLRMWAFEVSPPAGSELRCVFYPYPAAPERGLEIAFTHSARDDVGVSFYPVENGARREITPVLLKSISADFQIRAHTGEDLQGVYWGATASVALKFLEKLGGKAALTLAPGDSFPGNFYKLLPTGKYAHMGSCFPAKFPDAPFSRDSMGTFSVVAY